MTEKPAFMNWHENKPSLNLEGVYFRLRTYLEYSSMDISGPSFTKIIPNYKMNFRRELITSADYISQIQDADPEPNEDAYIDIYAQITTLQACNDWGDVKRAFPEGLQIGIGGSEFDFWVYVGIKINWEKELFAIHNKWDYDDGPYIADILIQKITEKIIK